MIWDMWEWGLGIAGGWGILALMRYLSGRARHSKWLPGRRFPEGFRDLAYRMYLINPNSPSEVSVPLTGSRGVQLVACFTRVLIRDSVSGVSSVRAKAVG